MLSVNLLSRADAERIRYRRMRRRRLEIGLCVTCGRAPKEPEKTRCTPCAAAHSSGQISYYMKNREAIRLNNNAYSQKNREALRDKSRRWYLDNPERVRAYGLKKYGMTTADYDALFAAQGGCCAICGSTESRGKGTALHVDHDHETGKVRALLCSGCNTGIGKFREDPEILASAIRYLRQHEQPKA